ncbi:MAG TPA: hypothetical protein VGE20_04355 [Ramlibacter sp.]
MTRFESPAFHQPGGRWPAAAMRALLGAAALAFTAGLWVAVGSQAGQFGAQDTAEHVTLPPVVVSGRRLPPEAVAAALGAGPAPVDCARDAYPQDASGKNRVNLNQ